MKGRQEDLINDLERRVQVGIEKVAHWKEQPQESWKAKPAPEAWNALECIEHLNRYNAFYLPEVERVLASAETAQRKTGKSAPEIFKSTWLGEYFSKSVMPRTEPGEKLNTMNTFKVMNPANQALTSEVVETYLKDQDHWLALLDRCRAVNLTRNKTAISISKIIKLRLGDTLRVVIYHQDRHLVQAQKALASAPVLEGVGQI